MLIKQTFVKNTKYEVLTPSGWENFDGVFCNYDAKDGATLFLKSGKSITATDNHRFYSNGIEIMVKDLNVGDSIDTSEGNDIIVDKKISTLNMSYDVFNSESHRILTNSVIFSHQCDELGKISPKVQQEFWSSVRPTLSCIVGDTLVLSQHGFRRIEDYHTDRTIGEYFTLNDLMVWGKDGLEIVSHGYVSPNSDTLKINLESGHMVEVTLNHPLYHLTPIGGIMKKSKKLTIGDYLRVDYNMNVYGDETIPLNLAYMLGGYIHNDESCSQKLKDYSEDYVKIFQSFGIDQHCSPYNKQIPYKVFGMIKECQAMFLQGLFDCCGDVFIRSINLSSKSFQLIQQVQLLLANMGIVSHIAKKNKDHWMLSINRSQYALFRDIIGFGITRKKEILDKLSNTFIQDDRNLFKMPSTILRNTIKTIIQESGKSHSYFRQNGARLDKVLSKDGYITVCWLKQFAKIIKTINNDVYKRYESFFKEFNRNATWYKIVSITPSSNQTYDFTVPNTHSFLQNGIIGSNTGGRCIITSTPDNDTDLFSQLWKGAENNIDEYGNKTEAGINGFVPIKAIWSDCPDRTVEWAIQERKAIGEDLFLRDHECEFISMEATLINSMVLSRLSFKEPLYTMGSVRWFKEIDPSCTYIVSLDPSAGVGKDFAAIQIMEMPSMIQVGEWMHNRTPQKGQLIILLSILKFLASKMDSNDPEIYWSFENNSVGEGIIQLIIELGEEKFPGILINEPKLPSMIKKSRKGLHTTNKVKLLACSKLKAYLENDKMVLHSHALLYQLKNYVATGVSFAGKPGVNDDLISSLLVNIRVMLIAAQWGSYDESVVREIEEEFDEPLMPIVYSSYY